MTIRPDAVQESIRDLTTRVRKYHVKEYTVSMIQYDMSNQKPVA